MRCGTCVDSEGRKEGEGYGGGRDQIALCQFCDGPTQ
jgi:hypothetical protein